jgi:hypothetical protein
MTAWGPASTRSEVSRGRHGCGCPLPTDHRGAGPPWAMHPGVIQYLESAPQWWMAGAPGTSPDLTEAVDDVHVGLTAVGHGQNPGGARGINAPAGPWSTLGEQAMITTKSPLVELTERLQEYDARNPKEVATVFLEIVREKGESLPEWIEQLAIDLLHEQN